VALVSRSRVDDKSTCCHLGRRVGRRHPVESLSGLEQPPGRVTTMRNRRVPHAGEESFGSGVAGV